MPGERSTKMPHKNASANLSNYGGTPNAGFLVETREMRRKFIPGSRKEGVSSETVVAVEFENSRWPGRA